MKHFRRYLSILFLLQLASLNAQVSTAFYDRITRQLRDSDLVYFDKGKAEFEQESFLEALPYFEKILVRNPALTELSYLVGICYSYDVNQPHRAMQLIRKATPIADKIDGYDFNLAFALEKSDSITAAIEHYKTALLQEERKGLSRSQALISEIIYRIDRCNKINEYSNRKNIVSITNIGKPVNSDASEYAPLIDANEKVMIFTYRGPLSQGGKQKIKKENSNDNLEMYFEDVFMSRKINDSAWSAPSPVSNLNTTLHDAAVCLSQDGSQLFIYRNNGAGKGDLFLSTLNAGVFSKPVFQSGVNSQEWEGSACFIPNSNKIIFASERKGGFGGKDLYTAERLRNNVWGNIVNLGPEINTKYDEDAPFVTVDGKILFYSSNNSNSIGGYDIFRSDFKNGQWQKPYNLGPPINTKNDDKFFIVRADGKVGYYSSFKQGGKGEQDIYRIEPGIPGKPVELLQVEGLVTIDGKPASASIEINSALNNQRFSSSLRTAKGTGNFLTNLPSGDLYELVVKVDKFPPQMIELNTQGIDSFVVMNVYADFISAEYDKKLEELHRANAEREAKAPFNQEVFAASYGDYQADSLFFTVQIGAFKFFENFNYNNILGLPKIVRQTGRDYITRFVMGNFKTYNGAAELLNKIRKTSVPKGAFILAYYKGERKYLYQLVQEGIVVAR